MADNPETTETRSAASRQQRLEGDARGGVAEGARTLRREMRAEADSVRRDATAGAHRAADEVRAYAEDQKERAAQSIDNVAAALGRAAEDLEGHDEARAAVVAREVAGGAERLADYMRHNDLGTMVGSLQDFARREPVAFVGGATIAGFLIARFLKSSARDDAGRSTDSGRSGDGVYRPESDPGYAGLP